MEVLKTHTFAVKDFSKEKRLIYAMVYEPNVLDTDAEMMLEADVEKACHEFMLKGYIADAVDTDHNHIANACQIVECAVARKGDDLFPEGSWWVAIKCFNDEIWEGVKSGKYAGLSLEGTLIKLDAVADLEDYSEVYGVTEKTNEHDHSYVLTLDEYGKVLKGRTNIVDGHYHEISYGTATDESEDHKHRYFVNHDED